MRWTTLTLKPAFYQVDSYGVVNNIYYAAWFEAGRFAVAEDAGLLSEFEADGTVSFFVCELNIKYIRPVGFKTSVCIKSTIKRTVGSKVVFHHRVLLPFGNILAAEGSSAVVIVRNKRLLLNLPAAVKEKVMGYING